VEGRLPAVLQLYRSSIGSRHVLAAYQETKTLRASFGNGFTFLPLPSGTQGSTYSFSLRFPAAWDKTARRRCLERHAWRGTPGTDRVEICAPPRRAGPARSRSSSTRCAVSFRASSRPAGALSSHPCMAGVRSASLTDHHRPLAIAGMDRQCRPPDRFPSRSPKSVHWSSFARTRWSPRG